MAMKRREAREELNDAAGRKQKEKVSQRQNSRDTTEFKGFSSTNSPQFNSAKLLWDVQQLCTIVTKDGPQVTTKVPKSPSVARILLFL